MRKEIQRLFKSFFSLDKTFFNQDGKTKQSKETPHTEGRFRGHKSSFKFCKFIFLSGQVATGESALNHR